MNWLFRVFNVIFWWRHTSGSALAAEDIQLRVFDVMFGCRHRNLSRVFTIDGQTYRVCCNCGAKFGYSLATMSIVRSTPGTQSPRYGMSSHVSVLNRG